jgi:hypothetical protein
MLSKVLEGQKRVKNHETNIWGGLMTKEWAWHLKLVILFFFLIIVVLGGVHCGIYKSFYNISSVSYLNSLPPPFSFMFPYSHSWKFSAGLNFPFTFFLHLLPPSHWYHRPHPKTGPVSPSYSLMEVYANNQQVEEDEAGGSWVWSQLGLHLSKATYSLGVLILTHPEVSAARQWKEQCFTNLKELKREG